MYLKNHTKDKREKRILRRRRKEVQQQRKSNCLPMAQGTRLQQNIQSIMAFTRLWNRICNILFWGLLASLKFVNSLFATAPDPTYYFQINIELPLFTSRHKSQQFPLSVLDQLRERRSPRTLWIHFGFAICNLCTWLGPANELPPYLKLTYRNRMAYGKSLLMDFFGVEFQMREMAKS